jgi:hypothetical protein
MGERPADVLYAFLDDLTADLRSPDGQPSPPT